MACDETAVSSVTVLLATEHWPSEERPRHTIHRQKGWLLTFSAPSSCTMNFKQQRRKELETKSAEGRCQRIWFSYKDAEDSGFRPAPDCRNQSLYKKEERNDTADHKGFARAGQGWGQDKGTFRKYLPFPPTQELQEGEPTSTVQKNKGKTANITFFSGQLESSCVGPFQIMGQSWGVPTLRSSESVWPV